MLKGYADVKMPPKGIEIRTASTAKRENHTNKRK